MGGIYEIDKTSGGSVTRTVTYYPEAGAMRINSTLYYIQKDHLGSASTVTDTGGNIVGKQRYYPYGETRWMAGAMFTDKLFTGQREMAGLGIYHYNARFYSPYLTQFSQPDSIIPDLYNPQALNRYSYVLKNPIRYNDPSGHSVCEGNGTRCQSSYTAKDRINKLKSIINRRFKWNVKGDDLTLMELQKIYQTGRDIKNYVDDLTGGKGLAWMNDFLGGINIGISKRDRGMAIPGNIFLPQKWITDFDSKHYLAHELAHIWDIKTGRLTILGVVNGPADWLNKFIDGKVVAKHACRFCDKSGTNYIPDEYEYSRPSSLYGNNSTADYLTDSFANVIYRPGNIPNPNVALWVNTAISVQTTYLP